MAPTDSAWTPALAGHQPSEEAAMRSTPIGTHRKPTCDHLSSHQREQQHVVAKVGRGGGWDQPIGAGAGRQEQEQSGVQPEEGQRQERSSRDRRPLRPRGYRRQEKSADRSARETEHHFVRMPPNRIAAEDERRREPPHPCKDPERHRDQRVQHAKQKQRAKRVAKQHGHPNQRPPVSPAQPTQQGDTRCAQNQNNSSALQIKPRDLRET
jgi:hypothetical protein